MWLESPQRILCSCLMPGLARVKPLGCERARALRSISSPPSSFLIFLSPPLLLLPLPLLHLSLFPLSLSPSLLHLHMISPPGDLRICRSLRQLQKSPRVSAPGATGGHTKLLLSFLLDNTVKGHSYLWE